MRLLIVCLITLVSCSREDAFPEQTEFSIADQSFTGDVVFQKLISTTGFKVVLRNEFGATIDQTVFRYIPYRFDTADVDHDNRTEIIVGLVKATRFDPAEKKRLFILRIDENHLRPMWLGSKVCQDLVDFKVLPNGIIRTLEQTKAGSFSVGSYYWESFGLTLEKYTHEQIPKEHAIQIFNE